MIQVLILGVAPDKPNQAIGPLDLLGFRGGIFSNQKNGYKCLETVVIPYLSGEGC